MDCEFWCDECGMIYNKRLPEDEAQAEALELFGITDVTDPEIALICDDCFKEIFGAEYIGVL